MQIEGNYLRKKKGMALPSL